MPVRIENSEWREKRFGYHGDNVWNDIKENFAGQLFSVTQVANLPALESLKDRTAYDYATAICRELELRGKLKRYGQRLTIKIDKPKSNKVKLETKPIKKWPLKPKVNKKSIKKREK